ncbi:MAG: 1-deoxy-D-xylulose-5-phosphate reductoisomerase [Clostridia bacterium]|nr:1-deoxy-D-xylulose-5-phosphate reductoisomerase [Clostridia bacterium]
MKKVAVLGATGSVGTQAIEVIRANSAALCLCAASCHRQWEKLVETVAPLRPATLITATENALLSYAWGEERATVYSGKDALTRYAREGDYDILLVAVTGIHGLAPTLAALERGKTVALANKETLVCGGHLVEKALEKVGKLVPVDSEHSAIHQCLKGEESASVEKLILTCSGGALRSVPIADLAKATPQEVLAHPNWSMGNKITVDCATMVNKGFEVVEAHYLFNLPYENIEVLLHPESTVHSMVEFVDGAVMAQLGTPDMRLPIQYALTYPLRLPSLCAKLSLAGKSLHFQAVDGERYPCFGEVLRAACRGPAALVALNAADEYLVEQFLLGHIQYGQIHTLLAKATAPFSGDCATLDEVLAVDEKAREYVRSLL